MSIKKIKRIQEIPTAQFGAFVKSRRNELGFQAGDVARYLGVSINELLEIENGGVSIPLNQVYALSNCLNIDPRAVLDIIEKGGRNGN